MALLFLIENLNPPKSIEGSYKSEQAEEDKKSTLQSLWDFMYSLFYKKKKERREHRIKVWWIVLYIK